MSDHASTFRLIVGREVRERWRSAGFWLSTWLSIGAVVLALVAPSLRGHDRAPLKIGVVGTVDAGTGKRLLALVTPTGTIDPDPLPVYTDQAQARAALRAHAVDAVVIDGVRIVTLDPFDRSAQDRRSALVLDIENVLASTAALRAGGLGPDVVAKVQNAKDTITVEAVNSSTAVIDRSSRRTTAAAGIGLIAVFTIVYGTWMIDGILEEKSSRVVELLATTLRPGQLLRGKYAGVGLVALAQGVLLTVTALGVSGLFAAGAPVRANKMLVVGVLVWFLLGYCCSSAAFALAAAFSRRHAEAQAASFLVLAPLLGAVAVSVPTLVGQRPDRLLRILSIVPFTSPIAMPVRQALENVSAGPLIAAGAALLATAALLVWLGSVVYTGSVLEPAARRTKRSRPAPALEPAVDET
jgi:ABC-2 type transport system permease protein